MNHVARTTSPISVRNPGSVEPRDGAIAQGVFLPIYNVTKLSFRASDNATFQTVMTLQNPAIHNANKCSYLILKIALYENLK